MARSERACLWTSAFFGNLVADRVRFALPHYFSRKAQVADIIYNDAILKTGFPVPRDFALSFYSENPLRPGESRKIKLKINGKRHDALFQRPGSGREYRVVYDTESEVIHALRKYAGYDLKSGETALTIKGAGKNELIVERFRHKADRADRRMSFN